MSRSDAETAGLLAEARSNLIGYAILTDPKYVPYSWHYLVSHHLEAAVRRGSGRLLIFAPPQHGKSLLVSKKFPAWAMGGHPDWPIIAASYGNDLAEENGQAVRDTLALPMHRAVFPASVLDASSTAKTHFKTSAGGLYYGTTVRGGATGFPSKVFVIDDPFKSREEADSERVRESTKTWYRSVVYPRLAEDSILVIMHTRWHVDDLAGWLQREHPQEHWEILSLPAVAEEGDLMGRAAGGADCADRVMM